MVEESSAAGESIADDQFAATMDSTRGVVEPPAYVNSSAQSNGNYSNLCDIV